MTDIIHDETNPFSGVRSRVHFDEVEGLFHVEHIDDIEPLIERNKASLNGHGGWASDRSGEIADGDMRHVASIPNVVLVQLHQRGIDITNMEDERSQHAMRHLLNSSDFRFFRTTPGAV